MRRKLCGGILVAAAVALWVTDSAAQETGTPMFKAPYRTFTSHEFGAAFSDPGEGVSYAMEGFYSYGQGPYDFSIRGGWAELSDETFSGTEIGGGTRVLLGGDFRTRIVQYSESFPLDGALTVGLGANVGDGDDAYYIPVGFSLGRRFDLENSKTTFTPYAHPVLVPTFRGGDSNVDFALGLGVDVRFSQNFGMRVSGGVGDIEGLGIAATYIK
jgi:hypothetical protein